MGDGENSPSLWISSVIRGGVVLEKAILSVKKAFSMFGKNMREMFSRFLREVIGRGRS